MLELQQPRLRFQVQLHLRNQVLREPLLHLEQHRQHLVHHLLLLLLDEVDETLLRGHERLPWKLVLETRDRKEGGPTVHYFAIGPEKDDQESCGPGTNDCTS